MNGNRGQYTSAPLHNMKKRRQITPPPAAAGEENQENAPLQPRSKRYFALSFIMCLGLPLLFLAALIVPNNPLRVAFIGTVILAVAAMWILRAFAKSARGTLTVVYCALALVVGLALFMNSQNPETRNVSKPSREDAAAAFTDNDPSTFGAVLTNYTTPEPDVNERAAAASAAVTAAQQQLELFMQAWAMSNVPQMLEYVLPSWKSQQPSPDAALWNLTLDSHPINYIIESVKGSDGDTTRTIVMKTTMTEITGAQVVKRMQVLMFKGGQTWYVDPQSLNGTIVDEAAEAAANAEQRPVIGSTIAPQPTQAPQTATSGITLYYNPQGGKYYHAKSTCEAVDQQYWPLSDFPYDVLNSAQYSKLFPCPKCNPPARNLGN